jgi:hypothetical protein
MIRTIKKRKIILDRTLIITTEESLFDIDNAKMNVLMRAWMAITDATLDREKRDEMEVASMNKELDHLRHQEEYYQNSTQAVVLLKSKF